MDFLIPPLCLGCDKPVGQAQALCATCWNAIHFIDKPYCAKCGAPFDFPVDEGTQCGACLDEPPLYTAARAALVYDEASKPLILRLKHADRLHPVPALAAWMARAGGAFWPEADVIVPVPLHRWRLLKRRYNQAALLAQGIGRHVDKRVDVDLLVRHRATETQGRRNRKERKANVAGAFALRSGAKVEGQTIVLIDDVLTSGATADACAKLLFAAGARAVYVVALARAHKGN